MTERDIATWAPPTPAQQHRRRAGRIVFWVLVGLAARGAGRQHRDPGCHHSALSRAIHVDAADARTRRSDCGHRRDHLASAGATSSCSGCRSKISGTDDLFVKRVIGLPGDHVACCDAKGRITVNGKPLNETYLYPGDPPSRTRFSVTVGKGKIWVMGDHRNISVDSRKWGPVPLIGVVGQVILVGHGSSFAAVRTPRTFVADGLAPADTRLDLYAGLAIAAAAALAVLLLLAIFGIIRFIFRRRPRGAAPAGPARHPPPRGRWCSRCTGFTGFRFRRGRRSLPRRRPPNQARPRPPSQARPRPPSRARPPNPTRRRPPTAPERSFCSGSPATYGACPRSSGWSRLSPPGRRRLPPGAPRAARPPRARARAADAHCWPG